MDGISGSEQPYGLLYVLFQNSFKLKVEAQGALETNDAASENVGESSG